MLSSALGVMADTSVSAGNVGQGGVMAPSAVSVQTGDTLSAADHAQCDVVTSSALGVTADISVSADKCGQGGVMAPSHKSAQPDDTLSAAYCVQHDDTRSAANGAQPDDTLSDANGAQPDGTLLAANCVQHDDTLSAANGEQPDDTLSAVNSAQTDDTLSAANGVQAGDTLSAANDMQYGGVTSSALRAQHDETLSAADGAHADIICSAAETKPCDVITSHADIAPADVSVSDDAGVRDGSMTSFVAESVTIELTHLITNTDCASSLFLNNTDLNIIQCSVAALCAVSLTTFPDDVMLPCNLDALPVIQTHSKMDKLQLNNYNFCHNHMLLLSNCNHSNPHVVQVIDNLSCLSDRKERNRWVSSISQDGQAAVITPDQDAVMSHDQDCQDVVMSHDQDGQDVVISTQDDDEPSRPIHKVQRALGTPWRELL